MTGSLLDSRQHPRDGGRLIYMAYSAGYVMVRRPRAVPFVMTEKVWLDLPIWTTR